MNKALQVVMWKRNENGVVCFNNLWSGNDRFEAEIVASYYFSREIIKIQCLEDKNRNPWFVKLNMAFAKKVKCRITVQRTIDIEKKANRKIPDILNSFGDGSVEVFQSEQLD
jgi:hypothetical protein